MRATDSQGRPMRYVPRKPDPFAPAALHPGNPAGLPASQLSPNTPTPGNPLGVPPAMVTLQDGSQMWAPTLPGEATDEESLYALVNAMRAALLAKGFAAAEE